MWASLIPRHAFAWSWPPSTFSQTLNFREPVRIGDRIDVTVRVAELIPDRHRARLTCICKVTDEIVLDGEALVKVPSATKSNRPLPKL